MSNGTNHLFIPAILSNLTSTTEAGVRPLLTPTTQNNKLRNHKQKPDNTPSLGKHPNTHNPHTHNNTPSLGKQPNTHNHTPQYKSDSFKPTLSSEHYQTNKANPTSTPEVPSTSKHLGVQKNETFFPNKSSTNHTQNTKPLKKVDYFSTDGNKTVLVPTGPHSTKEVESTSLPPCPPYNRFARVDKKSKLLTIYGEDALGQSHGTNWANLRDPKTQPTVKNTVEAISRGERAKLDGDHSCVSYVLAITCYPQPPIALQKAMRNLLKPFSSKSTVNDYKMNLALNEHLGLALNELKSIDTMSMTEWKTFGKEKLNGYPDGSLVVYKFEYKGHQVVHAMVVVTGENTTKALLSLNGIRNPTPNSNDKAGVKSSYLTLEFDPGESAYAQGPNLIVVVLDPKENS